MTPETRYQHLMRDLRVRKLLVRIMVTVAIVLSFIMVVGSKDSGASLLAVAVIWGVAFLMRYLAKHASTVVIYFRTIHQFHREQDAILAGEPVTSPPAATTLLSDTEQHAFDDLVNRLKES